MCIRKALIKRSFLAILPVVIIVDSINRFSLWAIVPANLVVEKTKTEWPVLEPTLSRLGEEKLFYDFLAMKGKPTSRQKPQRNVFCCYPEWVLGVPWSPRNVKSMSVFDRIMSHFPPEGKL